MFRANAVDDEIDKLMTSAFTPIGSKISRLIPWKTDNLGEKYDELVPEPILDPKFNKELRHKLAFDPESEKASPPSPQPTESTFDADPPGFVSDEEFELTDEIGTDVEPEFKRSVNFDDQSSMLTTTIDNFSDNDSLPRKVERTKSLGPDIDFPPIKKPLNADKQRRASADNFDLDLKINFGEDNDRYVSSTTSNYDRDKIEKYWREARKRTPQTTVSINLLFLPRRNQIKWKRHLCQEVHLVLNSKFLSELTIKNQKNNSQMSIKIASQDSLG